MKQAADPLRYMAWLKGRDVGKWAQRLALEISHACPGGTATTDERGVLSVLAVAPEWVVPEIQSANDPARTCADCRHRLPHGTCGEPVAAGLAQNFAIAWPPAGYGASCAAFTPKPAPEAAGRAYALTKAQGDVAHAEAWDDAACALFVVRTARIQRRGFSEPDATDLAEQLHLRDVRADYRHACLECKHLAGAVSAGWRCGNHKAAGLNAAQVAADLVVMHQYCPGFADEGGGYA